MSKKSIGLTKSEIQRAFDTEDLRKQFPPILTTQMVADLLGVAISTLYEWISDGRFDGSFRTRGKGHRFWRDRVIDLYFNGPEWK